MPRKITYELVREYFEYNGTGLVWKKKKGIAYVGKRFGYIKWDRYRVGKFFGNEIQEHKLVWMYFYGVIPKILDHINCIRDDNSIENLREADYFLNNQNRSGVIGIYRDYPNGRGRSGYWKATIMRNGNSHEKRFPLTEEGFKQATKWRKNIAETYTAI